MSTPSNPLHAPPAPVTPLLVLTEVANLPGGATAAEMSGHVGLGVAATLGHLMDLAGQGLLIASLPTLASTPAEVRFTPSPEGRTLVLASTGPMRAVVVSQRP